jgi:hypothetical protein
MAERQLVTRKTLQRELVFNAATKPLAVAVTAAVAVAAFVLGTPWLLAVAVAVYVSLALTTLFDPDEAQRVGRETYRRAAPGHARRELPGGLAPEISSLVARAHVEEERIRHAIADSRVPFTDVAVEVEYLMSELERHARRAQVIIVYLGEQRPFQLQRQLQALRAGATESPAAAESRDRAAAAVEHQIEVGEHLRAEYVRFTAEIEHLVASLGAIHGELVRINVAEDGLGREQVTEQVRELRRRVNAVAEEIGEAVDELDRPPGL